MNGKTTDVAGSYLSELEMRLSELPLLQRRELLSDVANHIETARLEGAGTEIEMIDVLERLGSPEVIAAAAYEENRVPQPPTPPAPAPVPVHVPVSSPAVSRWLIAGIVLLVVLFLAGFVGLTRNSSPDQPPVPPNVEAPAVPPVPGG